MDGNGFQKKRPALSSRTPDTVPCRGSLFLTLNKPSNVDSRHVGSTTVQRMFCRASWPEYFSSRLICKDTKTSLQSAECRPVAARLGAGLCSFGISCCTTGTRIGCVALPVKQEATVGKTPRNLPDDPKGRRDQGEEREEDVDEGLDNEGRPRDPDKGDAVIPTPPPPD
jgi:hypothetical protein